MSVCVYLHCVIFPAAFQYKGVSFSHSKVFTSSFFVFICIFLPSLQIPKSDELAEFHSSPHSHALSLLLSDSFRRIQDLPVQVGIDDYLDFSLKTPDFNTRKPMVR